MEDEAQKQYLKVINSVLAIAFVLIMGDYLGFSPGVTGNFFAEEENPSCDFNRNGESREIPMDRCCYHASQQIKISDTGETTYYGSDDINYSLNEAAIDYCSKEGFELE